MTETAIKTLRVFISSPGDVRPERLIARRVVQRLDLEFSYHFKVESILWEREPLVASQHFQEKIVPPHETDVVVVILWSRLGVPLPSDKFAGPLTGKPVTGTEWEFEDALKANREHKAPDLLVYRKTAPVTASLEDEEALRRQLDQKRMVERFIQDWFMARDAKSFTAAFHTFDDVSAFEELLETHLRETLNRRLANPDDQFAPPSVRWHKGSPFRGLLSFDLEYAPVFFGRTRARNELRELLVRQIERGSAFALVVGASGSGKSSLVKSGLLSDLRLPGMVGRVALVRYAIFRPTDGGDDLLRGLAAALLSPTALPELTALSGGETVDSLMTLLREAPGQIARPLRQALTAASRTARLADIAEARVVVVVDQLEEIFTDDSLTQPQREGFVAALDALAKSGLAWVIATMRSDFFDRLETLPSLLDLSSGEARYLLAPPEPAEIAQIIRQPAREAGLRFDVDGAKAIALDEVIRLAASRDPAALPLLSFLLEQLWRRHTEDGVLTFAAYAELGGLEGALGGRAEELFSALPPAVQAELPAVLRSLVTVSKTGKATARTTALSSFAKGTARRQLVDALLRADARLLVADGDGGGAKVRVSHEALLTHWRRARDQIAKDARDLELRGRLEEASERWRETEKKDRRSLLLAPGLPLQEAVALVKAWGEELPGDVRAYTLASRQAARRRIARLVGSGVAVALALPLLAAIVGATMVWRGVRAIENEMAFQAIPGGCFQMGSPTTEKDRQIDESPQRQVCVKPFELGRFTVTQAEWSKVMPFSGNPSENKGDDRLPVEMVSWDEAQEFVKLMNIFGARRYALPSEAQWEYAARAGTATARYWGDGFADACTYANMADLSYKRMWPNNATSLIAADCDDGYVKTAPVGSYRPNGFGLYDMLGNVFQWVEDCYQKSYDGAPADGAAVEGASACQRVARGGSWTYDPRYIRSARRVAFVHDFRGSIGFRLVRDAE